MRFTLYGEAEGVLGESEVPLWASVAGDVVSDASISARDLGVRPGMRTSVAQSLVPLLSLCPESQDTSPAMRSVWETLWKFSPWLETVEKQAFFLQIPGQIPPIREIRDLLLNMDGTLSSEQRLRIGLAENPFLAQSLLAWSRLERVPGAQYYKVGRQQWVVSPALAKWNESREIPAGTGTWMGRLPIQCLWQLSRNTISALQKLGIDRLQDLQSISLSKLTKHFGKEALQWFRFFEYKPGGFVRINYPPLQHREVWHVDVGDGVDTAEKEPLLRQLTDSLAHRLQRDGVGALKVGVTWVTDEGSGCFERIAKKPAHQSEFLFAVARPGLDQLKGERLERFEVYAAEIRPLTSIQSSFTVHHGTFVASEEVDKKDLTKLIYQVNRKFPRGLQIGLRPHFRELRLEAVTEVAPIGYEQRA